MNLLDLRKAKATERFGVQTLVFVLGLVGLKMVWARFLCLSVTQSLCLASLFDDHLRVGQPDLVANGDSTWLLSVAFLSAPFEQAECCCLSASLRAKISMVFEGV